MLKRPVGKKWREGMLEAEMDDHLGYSKYDYKNKETDDSRNGYSPKTVTSSMGTIDLDIPRDRKGDFEPQIVKKNQTDISNIEDQVLSMYTKMTRQNISAHLKDVYGVDASPGSDITYDRSNPSYRKRMAKPAAGKKICHCFYGCGTFPSCSGGQSNGKKAGLRCWVLN